MSPEVLAAAAVLAAAGALKVARGARQLDLSGSAAGRWWRLAVGALLTVAQLNGDQPLGRQRRALVLIVGALGAFTGFALVGVPGALALGLAAPWLVSRGLSFRRARYGRAIDRDAAEFAFALAAGLGAGRSLRGALDTVAGLFEGPLAWELARAQRELALGYPTRDVLDGLRLRTGSRAVALIVGAGELQRETGGDLAQLLRELGNAQRRRLAAQATAHAATAQARFTALIVCLLPLLMAVVVEIARPQTAAELIGQPAALALLALGVAGNGIGSMAIWRIARVAR